MLVWMLTNPLEFTGVNHGSAWGSADVYLLGLRGNVFAIVIGAFARRLAERAAERGLRAASERGDDLRAAGVRLVRGVDGVSIALGLAGVAAFTIGLAVVRLVVDDRPLDEFWWSPLVFPHFVLDTSTMYVDRIRDLAVVIGLVAVAAVVVGTACARAHERPSALLALFSRRTTLIAFAVVVATLVASYCLHDDIHPVEGRVHVPQLVVPSSGLRTAFTAIGSTAWFTVAAGVLLARRRAENERLQTS
jgi:hypothetical protein